MGNEREILGITGMLTIDRLKTAYRARARELHPDVNRDGDEATVRHRMAAVIEAYQTLLRELEEGETNADAYEPEPADDDGFEVYREAIRLYQSVHPSKWKSTSFESLFSRMDGPEPESARTVETLTELMGNLIEAQYQLRLFLREYPGSRWCPDARDKLREVGKTESRYRRIVQSYQTDNTT